MTIKLIVGIGNIGSKYINTRHNFGHKYIQLLANMYDICLKKNDILLGYIGELKIKNVVVRLLIPDSYMNNSGSSIFQCVNFYHLSLQEVLVVHDDLDLLPGMIRIKLGTQIHTSHHGIQDIINKFNKDFNFYRLKIGVGRPKNKKETINFVLSQPSIFEKRKIDFAINQAILYTEDIVFNNFIKVMNKLHVF